jgi:glycosyl-4,4'-diaponeurosporenoate acyltransferase
MGFIRCFMYCFALGLMSFFIGRLFALVHFRPGRFPWREYSFERGGKYYNRFFIKKWKDRIPDMSRIFFMIMPEKKISIEIDLEVLGKMINETCLAEAVHVFLCIGSIGCLFIWRGPGGVIMALLFFLGNIPFIMVQRYNRARYIKTQESMDKKRSFRH